MKKQNLFTLKNYYSVFLLISAFVTNTHLNADLIAKGNNSSDPLSKPTEQQAIGEAPKEDTSHDLSRLFLRDTEVLLNPKELQLSIGFDYNTNENLQSFRKNRSRGASIPLGISYGLTKRLEVNASLPLAYSEIEIISPTTVDDESKFGIGDLSLGFSYKLKQETKSAPSVTVSFGVATPTGKTAKASDTNSLSTGSGFWGLSSGISLAKSIDPAVVFFNVGYQHTFEEKQFGEVVRPGDTLNYGFGAGLSVNNSIAFSARISGSFQKETKIDKKQLRGTSSEPISLVGSVSYKLSNKSPSLFKYIILNSIDGIIKEYQTNSSALFGHANSKSAITVGAANYSDTPVFGVTPPLLRSFSSAGGTSLFFNPDGTKISPPTILKKPDIIAPDNVNTTFFGDNDTDDDGKPNISGSSAAAPHVAGVVALLLEINPQLQPADIKQILQSTAVDIIQRKHDDGTKTTLKTGFDFDSGYGLINAEAAVDLAKSFQPSTPLENTNSTQEAIIVNDLNQSGGGGIFNRLTLLLLFMFLLGRKIFNKFKSKYHKYLLFLTGYKIIQ